nr:hypothetical protein Itr_chr11CG23290 [Ipomoea trifida]
MTAIRLRCVSIAGGGAVGRWNVFYELALLGEPSDSIQVLPVPYAVVCWIMKIVLEKNREEEPQVILQSSSSVGLLPVNISRISMPKLYTSADFDTSLPIPYSAIFISHSYE